MIIHKKLAAVATAAAALAIGATGSAAAQTTEHTAHHVNWGQGRAPGAQTAAVSAAPTSAGAALATDVSCGDYQGGGSGSPWYGWQLKPCIYKEPDGGYLSTVSAVGGSTDVRLYTGVYDSCNGVTYGINGDSSQNHAYPTYGWTAGSEVYINCPTGLWGIARLTDSGNGSPWTWSTRIN
ncbi:hypothetical protein [Streptomyces sp. NRRL S-350]|uniref:hypothetical protein n=1 Tax=Streptomyces sp. NRRL S-350 TaxID=1463902 RepID=UPI0004BF84EF|nr:hypothetical protein [Streptomyces sp. NRRL S-350]